VIVTCTPNPSLDRTIEVDQLLRGEVQRVRSVTVQPGGKGINVARALHGNGHDVRAIAPLGGAEGELFARLVQKAGVPFTAVEVDQAIRVNITLAEADGTTTKLNDHGPTLDDVARNRLLDATLDAGVDARWLAGCGSLPPGAGDDLYADLVTRAHAAGRRVAVDTSGPALTAMVDAGPDLIKPNHHELAELIGDELKTFGDVVEGAREVIGRGVASVLVSLGGDGALLVTADDVWFGESDPVAVRSTVGAGDSLLAGFLAAGGDGPEALATGIAWATAAVSLPGSTMPAPDDLALDATRVGVTFNADRPLEGD
jgi:1-phosphofructokinase